MPLIIPKNFVPASPAVAGDVNANFQAVKVFVDAIETGVNIDNGAISTAKIADNAITQAKLSDRVVGSAELASMTLNPVATATYTLQLADAHRLVTLNFGTSITLTIPLSTSVNFQVGDQVNLLQIGDGQVTVVGVSGVSLRSDGAKYKLAGKYAAGTLVKIAADEWVFIGNTAV